MLTARHDEHAVPVRRTHEELIGRIDAATSRGLGFDKSELRGPP